MLTMLLYVLIVGLVAALLFLVASAVFGRGEELGPLPEGTTATVLPTKGISGADVRALRFQQVLRGYKAGEVDWALTRLAARIDELEVQLAQAHAGYRPLAFDTADRPRPATTTGAWPLVSDRPANGSGSLRVPDPAPPAAGGSEPLPTEIADPDHPARAPRQDRVTGPVVSPASTPEESPVAGLSPVPEAEPAHRTAGGPPPETDPAAYPGSAPWEHR
jgi:DivIVA domain-containing protein